MTCAAYGTCVYRVCPLTRGRRAQPVPHHVGPAGGSHCHTLRVAGAQRLPDDGVQGGAAGRRRRCVGAAGSEERGKELSCARKAQGGLLRARGQPAS